MLCYIWEFQFLFLILFSWALEIRCFVFTNIESPIQNIFFYCATLIFTFLRIGQWDISDLFMDNIEVYKLINTLLFTNYLYDKPLSLTESNFLIFIHLDW